MMNRLTRKLKAEDTVTLSRADYKRLVERLEDAEDARDARAVLQGVQQGNIEVFPAETARRLIDGESPIKVFRDHRGLSAAQLAQRVGIARPYLTQIENGTRQPMFGVMQRIAEALSVSLDHLRMAAKPNASPRRRKMAK
jgi:DNA-binding XRE family transcriptional regulator